MCKNSIVETNDDLDRQEEKKGLMVTAFVLTGMTIIVAIGVVALILKGCIRLAEEIDQYHQFFRAVCV